VTQETGKYQGLYEVHNGPQLHIARVRILACVPAGFWDRHKDPTAMSV
jgi:hypothetical protein